MAWSAPDLPSSIDRSQRSLKPWEFPPFGTDMNGRPLIEYATQGARVIAIPSLLTGVLVALFGMLGGLLRCVDWPIMQAAVQFFGEIVGALPRMVVILVVALLLPLDWRSLTPLAIVWAVLSAPGAIDEAGAVAARLGGTRFVEALKAHGFGAWRIYMHHIVALNLRPVLVRQGAEAMMTVAFLEVALSYLAGCKISLHSPIQTICVMGRFVEGGVLWLAVPGMDDSAHVLFVGLGMLGLVVLTATALSKAAEAR